MASDYVLRLIDQIALMLSEILQLRKLGRTGAAHAEISKACLENVGLPLKLVKRSAPETILEMQATSGGTQHLRAIMGEGTSLLSRRDERAPTAPLQSNVPSKDR